MPALLILTAAVILLYLLYPVWLKAQAHPGYDPECSGSCGGLSVIYLSRNGSHALGEKIRFLLEELDGFERSELIVIDDASTDGSREILAGISDRRLRTIFHDVQAGIPHCMNSGAGKARHDHIVFCDQRQRLSRGILLKLAAPLADPEVGAVSCCISSYDKRRRFSLLRAHENFIKQTEGRTGNLMGVYGPLYALRKSCYRPIPGHIILDDLYLTLCILSTRKVIFLEDCQVYDDSLDMLYDYARTRRYLRGFGQLLRERNLLSALSVRQRVMLLWHKYLRISIPVLLAICYAWLGVEALGQRSYLVLFCIITGTALVLQLPMKTRISRQLASLLRFVAFYTLASAEIFVTGVLKRVHAL